MLALPTHGFSQPTDVSPDEIKHNIELDIFCDWIESCVLFDEDRSLDDRCCRYFNR